MSKYFEMVKSFYDKGLWKEDRVHDAVIKGWITAEEYEVIIVKPSEVYIKGKGIKPTGYGQLENNS